VSVLVVDDHRMFADALSERLRIQPGIGPVEVANTLREGAVSIGRYDPDIVVVDLDLHGEWGPALLVEDQDGPERAHRRRFIVLSGSRDPATVSAALSAGVDGYVAKAAPFDSLLDAFGHALRDEMYLPSDLVGPVVRYLAEARDRAPRRAGGSFLDHLTPRELDVLHHLMAGQSRAEIAADLHISVATVRTHVQHLLKGAEVHSTLALIAAVRDAGLDHVQSTDVGPTASAD
jgi:DNA-binding NarL/FixJ family response regulator